MINYFAKKRRQRVFRQYYENYSSINPIIYTKQELTKCYRIAKNNNIKNKRRKSAIVECLDYQVTLIQLTLNMQKHMYC